MTINFVAKLKNTWKCARCGATSPRGRWPRDGFYAEECQSCVDWMIRKIAEAKAKANPVWFLGQKK